MNQPKPIVAAIAGMFLAGGCGMTPQVQEQSYAVKPTMAVQHAAGDDAEAQYQLGRYHQGRVEYGQAIEAYRRAAAANPGSSKAYNALGVIHAAQGKYEEATAQFKLALLYAPGEAYLHNNLGYARLLQDKLDEAVAEFREALRLDPLNARARANLSAALVRMAPPEPALAPAEPAAAPAPTAEARARLVQIQPGVYQLRLPTPPAPVAEPAAAAQPAVTQSAVTQPAATQSAVIQSAVTQPAVTQPAVIQPAADARPREATTPAPPAVPAVATPARPVVSVAPAVVTESVRPALLSFAATTGPVGFEVSNGNGIEGFAQRFALYLKGLGMPASRLTNHATFQLATTRIEYRRGKVAEAMAVNGRLPAPVAMMESHDLRWDVAVRLVLGQDLIARNPAATPAMTKL